MAERVRVREYGGGVRPMTRVQILLGGFSFWLFAREGGGALSGRAITGRVCEYQVFHTALNGKEAPVPDNSSYAFWIRARFPTWKGMWHLRLEIFTIFVMLVLFLPALFCS